jgi:hypothetical protein
MVHAELAHVAERHRLACGLFCFRHGVFLGVKEKPSAGLG